MPPTNDHFDREQANFERGESRRRGIFKVIALVGTVIVVIIVVAVAVYFLHLGLAPVTPPNAITL